MNFKKWIFSISFLIITQFSIAQITGKVIEKENNEPLKYASVALYQTINKTLVTGVITDANGLFSFSNVKFDFL